MVHQIRVKVHILNQTICWSLSLAEPFELQNKYLYICTEEVETYQHIVLSLRAQNTSLSCWVKCQLPRERVHFHLKATYATEAIAYEVSYVCLCVFITDVAFLINRKFIYDVKYYNIKYNYNKHFDSNHEGAIPCQQIRKDSNKKTLRDSNKNFWNHSYKIPVQDFLGRCTKDFVPILFIFFTAACLLRQKRERFKQDASGSQKKILT